MSSTRFAADLEKLSRASLHNFLGPGSIHWPECLPEDGWFFTPELISLYGTAAWESLDAGGRRRLSFYEAVNFFSLNVHGEKYLVSEVARRLYTGNEPQMDRYLLHLVEEEAKHMMYFSSFCLRYAGRVYPDRTLTLADASTGSDDLQDPVQQLLLFARIYLFEEIVDEFNRTMATDERLVPVVRRINHLHHIEEARHLAFGRKYLAHALAQLAESLDGGRRRQVREHLDGYRQMVWAQYYNPDVYADTGIPDSLAIRTRALTAPFGRQRRRQLEEKRLDLLRRLDLLPDRAGEQ